MIGWPKVGLGGVDPKLSQPSDAPTEQRMTAITTRALKMPDCEVGFFFMGVDWINSGIEDGLQNGRIRVTKNCTGIKTFISCCT